MSIVHGFLSKCLCHCLFVLKSSLLISLIKCLYHNSHFEGVFKIVVVFVFFVGQALSPHHFTILSSLIRASSNSNNCEKLMGLQGIQEVCKVCQFVELMMIRRGGTPLRRSYHSVLPSEGVGVEEAALIKAKMATKFLGNRR